MFALQVLQASSAWAELVATIGSVRQNSRAPEGHYNPDDPVNVKG